MNKKLLRTMLFILLAGGMLAGCAVGPRAESTPGISADENHVYVSYMTYFYQLEKTTGQMTWKYPEKTNVKQVFYAPAMVDGDAVYVGDFANDFMKFSSSGTPAVEWTFEGAKGWYQARAVKVGNLIIAPNTDRNIYAIDENNQLVWTHEGKYAYISEPIVVEDMLVVSSQDHKVVFINAADGTTLREVELNGAVVASPVYDAETDSIYIGSLANEFVRIDRKSGEILWRYNAEGALGSVWAEPVLMNGEVIVGDENGRIVSLSPQTGTENWSMNTGGSLFGGLALVEGQGFLVALEDGTITLYGANQASIWSRKIEGKIYDTPTISGDLILVGAVKGDNLVYAFDLQGQPVWTFKAAK